ncbi:unnamed protein product, partial [Prorocentrum cordatum]
SPSTPPCPPPARPPRPPCAAAAPRVQRRPGASGFPPRGNVDVIGSMVLHGASFSLMTWVAFILAGFCASLVTNSLLQLLGMGAEKA